MNPSYELSNPNCSPQQAHAGRPNWSNRPERPARQIDGILSISALRLVKGVASVVRRSGGVIFRWYQRHTANRELRALSDHYLKDIGLDRSQIVSPFEETIEPGGQPAAWIVRRQQRR